MNLKKKKPYETPLQTQQSYIKDWQHGGHSQCPGGRGDASLNEVLTLPSRPRALECPWLSFSPFLWVPGWAPQHPEKPAHGTEIPGPPRVARSYLGTSWLWLPCLLFPHPQASDHSFPGSLGISDKFQAHHKIPGFNKISLVKVSCKSERWASLSIPELLEHLKPIKFKWLEFGKTWTVTAKLLGFISKPVFT